MDFKLKYSGKNDYGGFRFSCNELDKDTFGRLGKIKDMIDEKKFGTSNPVYKKDLTSEYISVTCKRSHHVFKPTDVGNTYYVGVVVLRKEYEGKQYINFEVMRAKLVSKVNHGTDVSASFTV